MESFTCQYWAEFDIQGEPEAVEMQGTLEYSVHSYRPKTWDDEGCAGGIEFESYEREDGVLITDESQMPPGWRGWVEDNGPHLEVFDDLRDYTEEF